MDYQRMLANDPDYSHIKVILCIFISLMINTTYQARCVNCESTEHATTSVFILRNWSMLSLKAIISVGQTKVLKAKKCTHNQFYLSII